MIVLGIAGTAGLIRIMRANLLDELHKPYVETGRAKGLPKLTADPEVSGARRAQSLHQHRGLGAARDGLRRGHRLHRAQPADHGPDLYGALAAQDMYLAGALLMLQGI